MKRSKDLSPTSDRRVLLMKQRSSALETPDLHYQDEDSKDSSGDGSSTPSSSSRQSLNELRVENLESDDYFNMAPQKQTSILSQTMGPPQTMKDTLAKTLLSSKISAIQPSPARSSIKTNLEVRSQSAQRNNPAATMKNVSFKDFGFMSLSLNLNIAEIHEERQEWQKNLQERFLELPLVDPQVHTSISTIFEVVRSQTTFLADQFKNLDQILDHKKELVQKYKALVNVNTKIKTENADLLAELNHLRV